MSALLPAHCTKHLRSLNYPFLTTSFLLAQSDHSNQNGTTLWLGAQCLSLFLADLNPGRAIELGSGIGLTALALSSLGWDVIATDTRQVITTVLSANIRNNIASGHIQIRELDWTVPPSEWDWHSDRVIASASSSHSATSEQRPGLLRPPFDLVCSADTVYDPSLIDPLLRTLHAVCTFSRANSPVSRAPPVYLCVERRDPALMERFLSQARSVWHFAVERIPHRKVIRAVQKGGINWPREEWEGIEIWKLNLSSKPPSAT